MCAEAIRGALAEYVAAVEADEADILAVVRQAQGDAALPVREYSDPRPPLGAHVRAGGRGLELPGVPIFEATYVDHRSEAAKLAEETAKGAGW